MWSYDSVPGRLYRAFAPLVGGAILDVADFVTYGPIGLAVGFQVGWLVGWWIGRFYGFSKVTSLYIAILVGIYCTVPYTEMIPLATMVSAAARYHAPPPNRAPPPIG